MSGEFTPADIPADACRRGKLNLLAIFSPAKKLIKPFLTFLTRAILNSPPKKTVIPVSKSIIAG